VAVAIVAGALANKPRNGGEAWVRLSWVLGLRRLGFDVHFVERLPARDPLGRQYFEEVVGAWGLEGRASLLDGKGEALFGMGEAELAAVAEETEILFNLSGHLDGGAILAAARCRAYVDLDPGFTQIWHADPSLPFEVRGHDCHVTVGLNIGKAGCPVPRDGIEWIPTLPPVVLEEWPAAPPPGGPLRFTTVATWRSPYGQLPVAGRLAGLKHHEFRRVLGLPARVPAARFELALDIYAGDRADLEALREGGWAVVSPLEVAADPEAFRSYLRGSGAEFSVAQGLYVEGATGWFSDRTAAYLASGRPALVQDTGVGSELPQGEGLLSFSSPEEAAAQARCIAADPEGHAGAARAIAEQYLDSDRVLGRLLEALGVVGA
jgi:hypothetical protein